MSIPILGEIEKLINEHGSAVILKERIALAKDQYAVLEKKVAALQEENAKFAGENKGLDLDNRKLKDQIRGLEKQLEEIHGKTLSEIEENIIKMLAQNGEMYPQQIAQSLGLHKTKAEFFLEKLEGEYINRSVSFMGGGEFPYYLESKGKEYAVNKGFV